MLDQNVDKFLVRIPFRNKLPISRILCQVLDLMIPDPRYTVLGDRRAPDVPAELRRAVANLRPLRPEPFLRLHMFPAEQAQVDWAHFGEVLAHV